MKKKCRFIKDEYGRIKLAMISSNEDEEVIEYSQGFEMLYNKYVEQIKKKDSHITKMIEQFEYVQLNKKELQQLLREYYRQFPLDDIVKHPNRNGFDFGLFEKGNQCVIDRLSKVEFKEDLLIETEEMSQENNYEIEENSEPDKFPNLSRALNNYYEKLSSPSQRHSFEESIDIFYRIAEEKGDAAGLKAFYEELPALEAFLKHCK